MIRLNFLKNFKLSHPRQLLELLSVVVIWAVLFGVVLVLGGKVAGLREQAANLKVEITSLETAQSDYAILKNAVAGTSGDRSSLEMLLPARNDVLTNIQLLEALAAQTQNVQSIKITEPAPDSKKKTTASSQNSATKSNSESGVAASAVLGKAEFTITLNGGFVSLMQYLKSFENQPFLATIKSIGLTGETATVGRGTVVNTGLIESEIEGTFYFLNE
ncbi:MAG: hypothetical protein A3J48_02165 [Candidatus Doudnabacteria bacterium RIFCSPHIGHO2_02_FULL_46_11]|uniref:Uncharacterized protein n=1 Tax=Candidatus Doudnabacteria bacterium RIFCSPHIGHO2_02_FULL_46_11 TaxID=1817832 RepID=A0A1F5P4S0_9BACT|nr:MAG: hypothetical protein A3J48_02165 [Candidatus Doudnabacteria bacterium RIFCSPHIGHO2_02_FULL_46_11]